jgi:hypothetical protein
MWKFKLHVLDAQGLSVSHKRVGFAKSSKILIAKSMWSVHKIEFSNELHNQILKFGMLTKMDLQNSTIVF